MKYLILFLTFAVFFYGTQAFMEYRLDKKALEISEGKAVIFTTAQS